MPKHKNTIKAAIVIVAYGNEDSIGRTLDAIALDKYEHDRVIIVDNHPEHASAAVARKHKAVDHVIESDNVGFGGGCNLGAEQAKEVDFIYFLNPDVVPEEHFLSEMKNAYVERPEWAAWMSLLLLPDGTVNSCGNTVHLSGLSWVLGYQEKAAAHSVPKEVDSLSGACFAVRQDVWQELGGFTPEYFLYFEDTELSSRLLLKGLKMGLWPNSQVVHDYEFKNSNKKWFYLERNRYVYMLTVWPIVALLLLAPLLIVCDLGLWLVSILDKRFTLRIRSIASLLRMLPLLPRLRSRVQTGRVLSSKDFVATLASDLDNPFLGRVAEIKVVSKIFNLYKKVVLAVL